MKVSKIILSISIVLFLDCDRLSEFDIPIYQAGSMEYGFAQAQRNGRTFVASGLAGRNIDYPDSLFYIHFTTETEEGYHRETISFGPMKFEPKEYTLVPGVDFFNPLYPDNIASHYSISEDDGDVIQDIYNPDAAYLSKINIEVVDTNNWIISGTFDVGYEISILKPKSNPSIPDKVQFREGVFEVRLIN